MTPGDKTGVSPYAKMESINSGSLEIDLTGNETRRADPQGADRLSRASRHGQGRHPDPWRVRRTLAPGHWGIFWPRQEPRRSVERTGGTVTQDRNIVKTHRLPRRLLEGIPRAAARRRWVEPMASAGGSGAKKLPSESLRQRSHQMDKHACRARTRPNQLVRLRLIPGACPSP